MLNKNGLCRLLVIALVGFGWGSSAIAAHIVFMIGEKEYQTWETLPAYFAGDLKGKGHTATFVTAPPAGEDRNRFPGLEKALKQADLLVLSVRRRAPEKAQMQAVRDYLDAGKPLLAIRTSSHAFDTKGKVPEGHADWPAFDAEVLGGNYHGHYKDIPAKVTPDAGNARHKILKGVSLEPTTKLYNNIPLKPTAKPLLWATVKGKPSEPVAWTHRYGPNQAPVFYTSLGLAEEFAQDGFRRLLRNAVDWALVSTGS